MTRVCILAAALLGGCAFEETAPPSRNWYGNVYLSRTKGMVLKHFSARITYSSNWVNKPKYYCWGQLPPGLSFDAASGEISGLPTEAGFWSVSIGVADVDKGIPGHGPEENWCYSAKVELAIYDKLIDD